MKKLLIEKEMYPLNRQMKKKPTCISHQDSQGSFNDIFSMSFCFLSAWAPLSLAICFSFPVRVYGNFYIIVKCFLRPNF